MMSGTKVVPYLRLLVQPRAAIPELIQRGSSRTVTILAAIIGVACALEKLPFSPVGAPRSWTSVFRTLLYLGVAFGIVRLWVHARLTLWLATGLGGVAPIEKIRGAIAWAGLPQPLALLFCVVLIADNPGLLLAPAPIGDANAPALLAMTGVVLICCAWRLALVGAAVGEVCGFSTARGFLAATVADAVVLLVAMSCAGLPLA